MCPIDCVVCSLFLPASETNSKSKRRSFTAYKRYGGLPQNHQSPKQQVRIILVCLVWNAGLVKRDVENHNRPHDFTGSYLTIIYKLQSEASGERLGWVDLDLGSSPGWWAASIATYCPCRMVEHPKSNSTQPSRSPDTPDCRGFLA